MKLNNPFAHRADTLPAAASTEPAPACEFVPRRLVCRPSHRLAPPQPGELMLWRFRSEWQGLSRDDAYARLSKAELMRVRSFPNRALSKRFAIGRAVLRGILSAITGVAPTGIELNDDAHGQPVLAAAPGAQAQPVEIAVTYAGVWILVGLSTARVGLAAHLPPVLKREPGPPTRAMASVIRVPARAPDASVQARHASLVNAAGPTTLDIDVHTLARNEPAFVIDVPPAERWQLIDLPMPGAIRAAAAVAHPVARVHAFGWLGGGGIDG
ncbi:4'-phosphopantetheinyl transferase family protein [Paraburkholderia caballeronis]|uniref:4'-phosphopantetheinyl transferase n=1 Tax=Paraburkholderia caballeronis TaxID=416943 RepID=A0A1H7RU62_9BURK|nr:hypothetical protein [Paraburkholderia caballeronis]PXW23183.1 hypothetical protein C7403_111165 [Paraburkholderia caballeronis]PXW97847.1 hypothetical protein C7407_111165 [Paraburkholderia caballeronis]RAJ94817.1 hypothetical protein C7409_111165 [Paraburkholderia caballeronis]SEE62886.1 hypothetical protein SAMN05445871_5539 [Paraburkholderia caballeronis]SEL62967.1 hypothetical protein SAMN05192542_110165 [Paraburkholderia caballeronis]